MFAAACNLLTGASSLDESSCADSCDAGSARDAHQDGRVQGMADGSRDSPPDEERADSDSGVPRDAGTDSLTSAYVLAIEMDRPVAYYRLDELTGSALDLGSAHADGTYGTLTTRGVPGLLPDDSDLAVGIAPMEAGVSAIVSVPSNTLLEPTAALTVECWVRASSDFGGNARIVSYGEDVAAPFEPYVLQEIAGLAQLYLSNVGSVSGSTKLSNGTTYYLAATYDGALLTLYVNGNVDGTQSASGTMGPYGSTPGLGIGGGASGLSAKLQYEGTVDEVAIYDTALPEGRILAHYQAGSHLLAPSPDGGIF
jgi:hypothetical protein